MKRIVIDCQYLQKDHSEEAAKSTVQLLESLRDHHVMLIVDDADRAGLNYVRRLFLTCNVAGIHRWKSSTGARLEDWQIPLDRVIREQLIRSLRPDFLIIIGSAQSHPEELADVNGAKPADWKTLYFYPGQSPHQLRQETSSAFLRNKDLHVLTNQAGTEIPLQLDIPSTAEAPLSVKMKLAFVAPLPPARTGIAFYAEDMAKALRDLYDVTVIVSDEQISSIETDDIHVECLSWWQENRDTFHRTVYNLGNSPFHNYMLDMIVHVNGICILHDFYLGDLMYYHDAAGNTPFTERLYHNHGYAPLKDLVAYREPHLLLANYPLNRDVIENALGIVVHSEFARDLGKQWYGDDVVSEWDVAPLLRPVGGKLDRDQARKALGIGADEFVVCSFGLLSRNKNSHDLIDAWRVSSTSKTAASRLVLVGEIPDSDYGRQIRQAAGEFSQSRVQLTDWTDGQSYSYYLAAADAAVQLRTSTRGETSAAVLDTMKCGIPTIINKNGSLAELPDDAVVALADEFSVDDLATAIDYLRGSAEARRKIGSNAYSFVAGAHSTSIASKALHHAIERQYGRCDFVIDKAVEDLLEVMPTTDYAGECIESLAKTIRPRARQPYFFIDVSAIVRSDIKTGIQRVVRCIVSELMSKKYSPYSFFPVYLADDGDRWKYRHAKRWMYKELELDFSSVTDEVIEYYDGDDLLIADFTGPFLTEASSSGIYADMKAAGVRISTIVYDILPLKYPQYFPWNAAAHDKWLDAAGQVSDQLICISKAVADDVRSWFQEQNGPHVAAIDFFHLGANIERSSKIKGLRRDHEETLARVLSGKFFLIVGTIEPRKQHAQLLDAFEELWDSGSDYQLVIVGKLGWMTERLEKRLDTHQERGRKLHWLHGISDEELEILYRNAFCLIFPSLDEGFGLPLIEAAQHKVPIIARDIPVFREVAGEHAFYFSGTTGHDLAKSIRAWTNLRGNDKHPKSDAMPWLSWAQSADQLLNAIANCNR